jgi:flagellar hook-length control protein FliK
MHAIAAAIGDHESKDAPAKDSSTLTVKAATGDLATGSTPQAPTTTTTAVKPLSETVLAQNTLAQNGNAMEKAVSHQITKALVQHLPNGDRMMVLRLTPPELGTVKIEVVERQGVFSARIHAEDDGVRLALERFLPSMRQDLRASDAPIRELTLSDQAQFQRSFADGQQSHQQDARQSGNRRQGDDTPRFSLDGPTSEPIAIPVTAALGGRVGQSWVDARA